MLRMTASRKAAASLALGATAIAAGSLGSYASFSGSADAQSQSAAAGTMSLTIPAAGTSNRLTVGASDIAPGDTVQRAFNLSLGGTIDAAAMTLTTSATTSSLLDTNATNGLQMEIARCSVAWTEAGTAPAYTYTCGGTESSVLSSRQVVGSAISLSNLALAAGSTNYLRLKLTLPTAADNAYQGLSSTISYQFASTQRVGTSK